MFFNNVVWRTFFAAMRSGNCRPFGNSDEIVECDSAGFSPDCSGNRWQHRGRKKAGHLCRTAAEPAENFKNCVAFIGRFSGKPMTAAARLAGKFQLAAVCVAFQEQFNERVFNFGSVRFSGFRQPGCLWQLVLFNKAGRNHQLLLMRLLTGCTTVL